MIFTTFTGLISIPMNTQDFMTGGGKHCTESEGAGMKEYIERAALKQELAPYEENDFSQQMDVILDIVDAQPAADVVEVRHGRWVKPVPGDGENYCSVCKAEQPWFYGYGYFESDYCPSCGARMEKEDEHEIP